MRIESCDLPEGSKVFLDGKLMENVTELYYGEPGKRESSVKRKLIPERLRPGTRVIETETDFGEVSVELPKMPGGDEIFKLIKSHNITLLCEQGEWTAAAEAWIEIGGEFEAEITAGPFWAPEIAVVSLLEKITK